MFSLLGGFVEHLLKKHEYNILILGVDNAGKTTLLERIKAILLRTDPMPPEKITPTVGLNLARIEFRSTKLVLWDLGGRQNLRSIWDKYYEEAHAVLYVVDSADNMKMEDARNSLSRVMQDSGLEGAPLLVAANKQDIEGAMNTAEILTELELDKLAEKGWPMRLQPTSALGSEGIMEGMGWLLSTIGEVPRTKILSAKQSNGQS